MESNDIADLRQKISCAEEELRKLRLQLHEKLHGEEHVSASSEVRTHGGISAEGYAASLSLEEISRYGRQLILPEIGLKGQLGLKQSSVLIVGCGGLGCPSALYLAAAGIGQLGLLDYDEVELSNLHRQVLHTEAGSDVRKCDSAADALFRINSHVQCRRHHVALNSFNAMDIVSQYDIVVDASDNVATRYLVNDACVLLNKPLVSGSALRFEGQLTVYHYEDGPCYRCLFPRPPPPETVTNCSDGGVVGMVPGVIGVLQAIEVVKIAAKIPCIYLVLLLNLDCSSSKLIIMI
eukprot:scpid92737/ scgid4480/ Adenylyltransferase and sulfurtransferase MOCS3; Molybdenum cofactor synthesis protein 3; Molybdopterin-synthase adenylyltransferase; Adenylyltransferase MOCS3; Sulfur carrier protein MOCS2A adenylyltransferase; Molybdopterin-synthase sulfurtransferase; Sulfur carrier protein MOCS2A sulfurtransferase; Sulfurtransferase MOCS3